MTTIAADTASAAYLKSKFEAGKAYDDYVATGNESQRDGWRGVYERAALTDAQRALVEGFTREINVIVVTGVWCGDCVQQLPLLERIAEASNGKVSVRYLDRDEHMDLAEQLKVNEGVRVPVAIFAAEDFERVSIFGDRTLARYRAMAARQLGPSCPLPGAPIDGDELDATLQDWLGEAERVHLLLRLSARLRQKHGD
ncbi:MAG: thioredoxin family protein [Planctomycetota bacterium]